MVLFEIDKNLKVNFYNIVLPFGLAVNLQMEKSRNSTLNIKEVAKQWPEFQGKKRAFISNN